MIKRLKSLFADTAEHNEESRTKSLLKSTKAMQADTIYSLDFAKEKLIKDHISKYKWRINPFNEDDDDEQTLKTILSHIQVYYMRITLENKEYMKILYKKHTNLIYKDEYNSIIYDKYFDELYNFAKRKWDEICKDYELNIDVYYKKFSSKHHWLSQVLFEYDEFDNKMSQLVTCIDMAIIDYKEDLEQTY